MSENVMDRKPEIFSLKNIRPKYLTDTYDKQVSRNIIKNIVKIFIDSNITNIIIQ
ncbi:unnamed protein product [marine sediment metagenome]|uniref:Uncharacterized protein n=1 Tax=marine sediment metagenome TaxID=412755 RepID=X1A5P0_9ZZZZ